MVLKKIRLTLNRKRPCRASSACSWIISSENISASDIGPCLFSMRRRQGLYLGHFRVQALIPAPEVGAGITQRAFGQARPQGLVAGQAPERRAQQGGVAARQQDAGLAVADQVARVALVEGEDAAARRPSLRAAGCRRSRARSGRGRRRRPRGSAAPPAAARRRRRSRASSRPRSRACALEVGALLAVADDRAVAPSTPRVAQQRHGVDGAVDALPAGEPRRRHQHEVVRRQIPGSSRAAAASSALRSAAPGSRSRPLRQKRTLPAEAGLRRASTSSPCVPSSVMT